MMVEKYTVVFLFLSWNFQQLMKVSTKSSYLNSLWYQQLIILLVTALIQYGDKVLLYHLLFPVIIQRTSSFKTPLLATNPLPNPLLSQTVDIGYFKLILILRVIDWKYFSLILKQSSMFIRKTLYFASHFIKCFFCKIQ